MSSEKKENRHPGILLVALVSMVAVGLVFVVFFVLNPLESVLEKAQEEIQQQENVRHFPAIVKEIPYENDLYSNVKYFPAAARFSSVVEFNNKFYVSSSTAIYVFSSTGEFLRNISYLNGLPGGQIFDMVLFNGKPHISTSGGLACLTADDTVIQYGGAPLDSRLTVMTVFDSRLVLGAEDGTLLSFGSDASFSDEYNRIPGAPQSSISDLTVWRNRLVVATRDAGIYMLTGPSFSTISDEQGLPSNVVNDLAVIDDELLVATMAGIVRISPTLQQRVIPATGMVRCLAVDEEKILAGSHDGSLYKIEGNQRSLLLEHSPENPISVNAINVCANSIYVTTDDSIYLLKQEKLEAVEIEHTDILSWPHISALSVDVRDNIWVGYFDYGLEILTNDGTSSKHIIDDGIRYVKCLTWDTQTGTMLCGSSKGLHLFNRDGSQTRLRQENGLISDEINHVIRLSDALLAVATGSGLSLVRSGEIVSMNAFHGLLSNKTLCLARYPSTKGSDQDFTLALGSLSGLNTIDPSMEIHSFTPDTSALSAHWVSALQPVENGLAVGTYTNGIVLFDPANETFYPVEQFNKVTVNPLAMEKWGNLLLVGTLTEGLLVYNQSNETWKQYSEFLPDQNVTALAEHDGQLYIGTELGLVAIEAGSITR